MCIFFFLLASCNTSFRVGLTWTILAINISKTRLFVVNMQKENRNLLACNETALAFVA